MQTLTLTIPEMLTEPVAMRVGAALDAVDGVDTVRITLAQARAAISYDEQRATAEALRNAILQAGFDVIDGPSEGAGCGGQCGCR